MCLDLSFSCFASVDPLPALGSSAVATDLVLTLHGVELVVETQLRDRDGEKINTWSVVRTYCNQVKDIAPPLLFQFCGQS